MIIKTINQNGIKQIHDFLGRRHRLGYDHFDASMLRAWAADAEFQMREGNSPTIELPSYVSTTGATVTFTVSPEGIDVEEVADDE